MKRDLILRFSLVFVAFIAWVFYPDSILAFMALVLLCVLFFVKYGTKNKEIGAEAKIKILKPKHSDPFVAHMHDYAESNGVSHLDPVEEITEFYEEHFEEIVPLYAMETAKIININSEDRLRKIKEASQTYSRRMSENKKEALQ